MTDLFEVLQTNPDFSAGFLVPFAALYMVAARRGEYAWLPRSFWPLGVAVFGVGWTVNVFGDYFRYSSLENLGMVICANGMVMSFVGRAIYGRIWLPFAFLFLMLPLPHSIHSAVMLPLQGLGAKLSATVLETFGIPVVRYGNVVEVAGHKIAVAEACSGLRMVLAFLIVTGVIVYLVDRPRWQKLLVLFSSVPIALACNVARIVAAAFLYRIGQPWLAQGAYHDGIGLVMMPVAIGLVLLEFWVLSNLLVVPPQAVAALADRVDRPQMAPGR